MLKLIDLFSGNYYLSLSRKNRPSLYLSIGAGSMNDNSFKIYRPILKKSIILKKMILFVFKMIPFGIMKNLFTNFFSKSDFIKYLEKKLNCEITTSIYLSTDEDKAVVQLMNRDFNIIGYMKVGFNELANQRIDKEIEAIFLLSGKKGFILPEIIFQETYQESRILLLSKLEIKNPVLNIKKAISFTLFFKKDNFYKLTSHPFIIQLRFYLKKINREKYIELLDQIIGYIQKEYYEVYSHGDFSPWNLSCNGQDLIMIDFEFFEASGLENLDLVKYHHSMGESIYYLKGDDLYQYTLDQISCLDNYKVFYMIFLLYQLYIKVYLYNEKHDYAFEERYIKKIYNLIIQENSK